MKLVIAPSAQVQIDAQLSYGIRRHGARTAERTFSRVEQFLRDVVLAYPRTGTALPIAGVYETIIPRTPFVVIYRIEAANAIVRLIGFFHHAQNRDEWAVDAEPES